MYDILHWIFLLVCCYLRYIMSFDIAVFSEKSVFLPGHVWYVREGHDFAINCTPVSTVKYQGARFLWKDHLGRGAARHQWEIYGNGTLLMRSVEVKDTDTYYCTVYLASNNKERYVHSVIVYSMANFYMEYPLFYRVSRCDYQLNSLKTQDIQEFVCQHYQTKCPFHTIFNCQRTSRLVSGEDGNFQMVVVLQQYQDIGFQPPECDIGCIKQSIFKHLTSVGERVVNKLIARENESQLYIYGIIEFDAKELNGKRIQTRCPSGYEVYEDVLCMPCFPGHFLQFDIGNSIARRPCKPCPVNFYQDRFGMDGCYKCSGISRVHRPLNVTFNMDLVCNVSMLRLPPAYMYIAALCASSLILICIVALCLACWSKRGKRQEKALLPHATDAYGHLRH